jgi:membrane protein implicated in regulation of membrane protease activity
MLIVLALLGLVLLPSPWNVVGFALGLVLGVGEIFLWNRTVKGRRPQVGAETLIGLRGVALSDCRPDGQISVNGTIWEAHCPAGVAHGRGVRVVGRSDLVLVVDPDTRPQLQNLPGS